MSPRPPGELFPRSLEPAGPQSYHVSELVRLAGRALEARFTDVWVEGEVSNLRPAASGHLYFTLKDAEAQLAVVMYRREAARLRFALESGLVVRCRGRLSIYEAQGKFQLAAVALEPAGLGALQLALEQLKARLGAEGLFDAGRKRPLPFLPRRVGLVTSPTGAALRDMLRVLGRRCPSVPVLLAPSQVQGEEAPAQLVAALSRLAAQPEVDVVIIGRGGGSIEDLWAFNDEQVVRAIAAMPMPVVSAVGHEIDFTLADLAADVRAPTPSAAAELVVPVREELRETLAELRLRLRRALGRGLGERRRALAQLGRALHDPRRLLDDRRQRVDDLATRLAHAERRSLTTARAALALARSRLQEQHPRSRLRHDRERLRGLGDRLPALGRALCRHRRALLAGLAGRLDGLSPLGVLARGYGLVRAADGSLVTDASQVHPQDRVEVQLRRGALACRVEEVFPAGLDLSTSRPLDLSTPDP